MKIFSEKVNINPKDFESAKVNKYDQLATDEEISGFREKIEKKVEEKIKEINRVKNIISKEKLIELAEIDFDSLSTKDLENSSYGDLEFITESINESINKFGTNKEANELIIAAPSNVDNLLELVRKHEKVVKIGELALYLSTLGMPAFNALAEDDLKVEIDGQEILLKDLADNTELTKEVSRNIDSSIEVGQESFSQKLADIYEEVKDSPDKNIEYGNLDESIEEADKFSDYAEFIQNSEKESVEDIIDNLKENGANVLLFGEYHGPDSNAANTVEILEKMQDDDHKIANIAFEFLSYTDPKAIELVEQFNNGEISVEDFCSGDCLYTRSDISPILEFAQDNNIPITGIETGEHGFSNNDLSRFTDISHRVGEIAEDNEEGEISAVFIGARHTTESNFNFDDPFTPEYKEGREEIDKNDYTIKEYLEELGLEPAAINLDNWEEYAKASDGYFKESYNQLEEEDAKLFGNHCMENWEKYQLEEKDVFAVNHEGEKNVYSIVDPGKITEVPSFLNAFKSIDDNYPALKEIMKKNNTFVTCQYGEISMGYNNEEINIAQIDSETGQIEEIFLPEKTDKDGNLSDNAALEQIGKIERLKKVFREYDPRLYKKEHEIKGNKKILNAIEKTRKRLDKLYHKEDSQK